MSLDGILYPMVVEEARLKPGLVPTHKGPAKTMRELKNAAKLVMMMPHPSFTMHEYWKIQMRIISDYLLKLLFPSLAI